MSEDKSWAIGLTQEQFHHEFMRRNPVADVIPDVKEWLEMPELQYLGIPPLPADAWTEDGPNEDAPAKYACRGCGREFDAIIARAGHERHCKQVIPAKEVA